MAQLIKALVLEDEACEVVHLELAPMTMALAIEITGGLSNPSKMPNEAYGIPAASCVTGSKYRKEEGTICSKCYAFKGFYPIPVVKNANERRERSLYHPRWTEAMIWLIGHSVPVADPYFRWFDTGDLPNLRVLRNIVVVAEDLHTVFFWLPTQEGGIVKQYLKRYGPWPANLVIRFSAKFFDEEPPAYPGSGASTDKDKVTCPSHQQGNICGECRDCWDPEVLMTWYPKH